MKHGAPKAPWRGGVVRLPWIRVQQWTWTSSIIEMILIEDNACNKESHVATTDQYQRHFYKRP